LPDASALNGLGVTGIFGVELQPAKNNAQAKAQTDKFKEGRCLRRIKGLRFDFDNRRQLNKLQN